MKKEKEEIEVLILPAREINKERLFRALSLIISEKDLSSDTLTSPLCDLKLFYDKGKNQKGGDICESFYGEAGRREDNRITD